MRTRLLPTLLLVLCCAGPAFAQTYTPKTIQLKGADGVDRAEVMRLLDLKPGAPVTKEGIEAAMQRLADSGLFTDMSYRVGPEALIFELTPAEGAQALSVRYGNLVWWKSGELEPLVEARVPGFHGQVPLTGPLTEKVEAALVALLAEKGVADAKVTARLSTLGEGGHANASPISGIVLSVIRPKVLVGQVQLAGAAPELSGQLQTVTTRLSTQEFDSLDTASAIRVNVLEAHRNAGYLDAAMEPPMFSAPHKEMLGYVVDGSAAVQPGAAYHVSGISFEGVPAEMASEVAKASEIKAGDLAGEMSVRIAEGLAARVFENRGMLDASAKAELQKDASAHTVAYHFVLVAGPVYTLAGVDASALPSSIQSRFAKDFHTVPGAVADGTMREDMLRAIRVAGAASISINSRRDRAAHTVSYVIIPKA